jgi:titin
MDQHLRLKSYCQSLNSVTGARIRSTFDFGHVSLSINGLRSDDSAIYTCKATNQLGEAVSTCTLKIEGTISY